jgi:hypothetical protein
MRAGPWRAFFADRDGLEKRLMAEIAKRCRLYGWKPHAICAATTDTHAGVATHGEVAEWLKAPHSKCGIGASLSGVRIPPSPPNLDIDALHHSALPAAFSRETPIDSCFICRLGLNAELDRLDLTSGASSFAAGVTHGHRP